jgi:GNAT superfamily N-acetyltransferase
MLPSSTIQIREAGISDISQIQVVRNSVTENTLSDPGLVPDKDVETYITQRGKGWVYEVDGQIVGFAIADLIDHNIWALFLRPQYEGMGIGRALHYTMLDWYFAQTRHCLWLSTSPGTRAELFYRKAGWKEVGMYGKGEIKFEMNYEDWGNKVHNI